MNKPKGLRAKVEIEKALAREKWGDQIDELRNSRNILIGEAQQEDADILNRVLWEFATDPFEGYNLARYVISQLNYSIKIAELCNGLYDYCNKNFENLDPRLVASIVTDILKTALNTPRKGGE